VSIDAIHQILQLLIAHAVGPLLTCQRQTGARDRERNDEPNHVFYESCHLRVASLSVPTGVPGRLTAKFAGLQP
jgi:hypothetical protein